MTASIDWALEDPLYIREASYSGRLFYLFDTHRTSLLCWAKAFNEGIIEKGYTLVTLDLHLDLITKDLNDKHINLAKTLNIDKIRANIRVNDTQDWIVMGMEAGIIDDIIIISPMVNLQVDGIDQPTEYIDTKGKTHEVKYFDSIESFEKSNQKIPSKLLLDIDLDYFKIKNHVKNIKFEEKDIINYFSPQTKLFRILSISKIVTIAMERHYTGTKGLKLGEKLQQLFVRIEQFKQAKKDISILFNATYEAPFIHSS